MQQSGMNSNNSLDLDLAFERLSMNQNPTSLPPTNQLDVPRRRGTVKFFMDHDPGALGGQEVFCHFSAIAGKGGFRSLAEGEEVEYELVQGPKGFQAANLTGPGGRTVVGDPKARLAKPPPYMPFAPLGIPYGDPYHQQHYAQSPHTQHVVYVPSQFAPPGPRERAYNNSYGQTFAPPGPIPNPPLGTINALNQPAHPSQQRHAINPSGYTGNIPTAMQNQQNLNGSPSNPAPPSFGGFAPWSPPTTSSLPLFGSNPIYPTPFSNPSFAQSSQPNNLTAGARIPSASNQNFSTPNAPIASNGSSAGSNQGGNGTSALFGTSNLNIGAIGSRSNTPRDLSEPRASHTPLNGHTNSSDWKNSSVLYSSAPSPAHPEY